MTWEFRSTISDSIHHLVGSDGRGVWGIDSDGFDEDAPGTLGTAEVDLPTGRRALLLVPVCPGGLVLDVVRAYQGLSEPELVTLFLGIAEALSLVSHPEKRLSLAAFGLDAAGRPVLIPGVMSPPTTSPRHAVGEMLYHAGHGRPWAECLLPVNLALAESSSALRSIVGDLLSDSPADPTLGSALAEVAAAMRGLARPVPLPLVPADRDLSPETALTARLRAVSGGSIRNDQKATDACETSSAPQLRSADTGTHAAEALRAASRRPRRRNRSRRRTAAPSARPGRGLRSRLTGLCERAADVPRSRWLLASAVGLTLFGAVIVGFSWSSADSPDATRASDETHAADPTDAAASHSSATPESSPAPDSTPSDEEIARVLDTLSADRARALTEGDAAALRDLTVPGSAAAAADELIDQSSFAGSDYAVDVEAVRVLSADADRIVASARMHSRAGSGATSEDFGTVTVEFTLRLFDDGWRVEQVIQTGDVSRPDRS